MTASISVNQKVSNFTLALLEGTGWYKPNYSLAMPLMWGHKRGCQFVEDLCLDTRTQKANFAEFCDNLEQLTCSLDRRYKAWCSINAGYGFADNCPYPWVGLTRSDCYHAKNDSALYDEVVGLDSRCFEGTLVKSEFTPNSIGNAFCFNYIVISSL